MLIILVTLFASGSSFAGYSDCYIGTAEVVSTNGTNNVIFEVKSLADGYNKATSTSSGPYEMAVGKKSGGKFKIPKGQNLKVNSIINFACDQEFTKRGPSEKVCILLTDDEMNMSKADKLKLCNISH